LNIVFSERTHTHKQTDKENFSRAHHDFVVHIPVFMLFDLSKKKKRRSLSMIRKRKRE